MSEIHRSELEHRLVALGREIDWPPTPYFDLELEPARRERGVHHVPRLELRPLALAFVVLFAVCAGVLALSPGARSAFLDLFHIRGASVERVDKLPNVPVQAPDFGRRVIRAEAERRVGFALLDIGPPDAVFLRGRMATLVYGPAEMPRLTLSELRGAVWDGFVKKVVGSGTRVERVRVNGEDGLFASGADHFVMFLDARGQPRDERTFLAGTVLLWNRGSLLLRLEGDLTRAEALALARRAR